MPDMPSSIINYFTWDMLAGAAVHHDPATASEQLAHS
jgi:hypothetical protein